MYLPLGTPVLSEWAHHRDLLQEFLGHEASGGPQGSPAGRAGPDLAVASLAQDVAPLALVNRRTGGDFQADGTLDAVLQVRDGDAVIRGCLAHPDAK